jgi:hypothetical protein
MSFTFSFLVKKLFILERRSPPQSGADPDVDAAGALIFSVSVIRRIGLQFDDRGNLVAGEERGRDAAWEPYSRLAGAKAKSESYGAESRDAPSSPNHAIPHLRSVFPDLLESFLDQVHIYCGNSQLFLSSCQYLDWIQEAGVATKAVATATDEIKQSMRLACTPWAQKQ